MFLGTLWSSIKKINVPYLFDGEHGISLHAMQGNKASFTARGKSQVSAQGAAGTWGIFSSYFGDVHSKLVFVQRHQYSCLVTRDTSGIPMRLGRAIWMLLEVKRETQCPFIVGTVILGFLLIFNKSQASSTFEALNSVCLTRFLWDIRPPVQMRRGPSAFSLHRELRHPFIL